MKFRDGSLPLTTNGMRTNGMRMIREFEPGDQQKLAQIYFQERLNTFTWIDPVHIQLSDFAKDTDGETISVLEVKGEIAGFCSVWTFDSFIHHLYIGKLFQGRGHGKALLESCLKVLKMLKTLKMQETPASLKCNTRNQRALEFYKSQGGRFKESGTDPITGEYHKLEFSK